MFQGFFTSKFLDFATTTSCLMNGDKMYIYRDSVRRYYCNIPTRNCYINYDNGAYHCTAWRKIICNICIFPARNWYIYCIILEDTIYIMGKDNLQHLYLYLQETDTFIGMRMFPTVHHREFLCVQRNPHYYPGITQGSFLSISVY